ncbi:MAG: PH domain-containing protein [bacterium]|nr:PH domain-containing protein [bacterium]MDE0668828.1 PH domain-containing protein [bacterium]
MKRKQPSERELALREQIRETMGPGLSVRKEVRYLPGILDDNEVIRGAARGSMKGDTWLVVCTDRRVIFVDKGLLWGYKQVEIPLEAVSSVTQSASMVYARFEILGAGLSGMKVKNVEKETAARFVKAVQAARRDLNA